MIARYIYIYVYLNKTNTSECKELPPIMYSLMMLDGFGFYNLLCPSYNETRL
jgi:hypothetical protein